MSDVIGAGILIVLGLVGLVGMTKAAKRQKLTASQQATTWLMALSFECWAVLWGVHEIVSLAWTPDPHDHFTATISLLLTDPWGRVGFAAFCAFFTHLGLHFAWADYPGWPRSRPSEWGQPVVQDQAALRPTGERRQCPATVKVHSGMVLQCSDLEGHKGAHLTDEGLIWWPGE